MTVRAVSAPTLVAEPRSVLSVSPFSVEPSYTSRVEVLSVIV